MKRRGNLLIIAGLLLNTFVKAQLLATETKQFSHADTLRGSLNANRDWNVLKYEIDVTPDINTKSIKGSCTITYKAPRLLKTMQIDLQSPLEVDSIVAKPPATTQHGQLRHNNAYQFKREGNIILVDIKPVQSQDKANSITVFYHGTPKEAKRPPWDGGLIWSKDLNGNPFIATACQGLGASVWWPCKDHQSDEPDNGISINITAPDSLSAISNGRLKKVTASVNSSRTWSWEIKNPINSYGVSMNIGKYVNWADTLNGEGGKLDLSYWVLDYNLSKAKEQFSQAKPMLHCFEYWFGKYPFYEDSYKLVETPFLGMEHQSAIAYGNGYRNGYRGKDLSSSGWGLKWDFIVIHESGHEWFGNNITTRDIADMWVHEGFTNYSETLFTQWLYGKEAAKEYIFGIRKNILNDKPVIGIYGVNEEGSGDMYYKAANMINNIRNTIDNDEKFRSILRGLNKTFFHKTVTTRQVEQYITKLSGVDFSKTFDQYLRTTQVPTLNYYFSADGKKVHFKWSNCIKGFNLPLVLNDDKRKLRIFPTESPKTMPVKKGERALWAPDAIEKRYYIKVQTGDSLTR